MRSAGLLVEPSGFTPLVSERKEKECVLGCSVGWGRSLTLTHSLHIHLLRSLSSELAATQLQVRRGSQDAEPSQAPDGWREVLPPS